MTRIALASSANAADAEKRAADTKREAESRPRSWWDRVKGAINSVFDGIKRTINGIFEAARWAVKQLIEGAKAVEAKEEPMQRYNRRLDEENARKVWSDPRANNYYWSKYGRSVVQNPLSGPEMWRYLRKPDFAELEVR